MEIQEARRPGSFILSLANGNRSLENGIVLSGEELAAGTVLGKITASGKLVAVDPDASDGSENAAGVLLAACDASDADTAAAYVAREAEIIEAELDFGDLSTAETAAASTQLAALQIILR